MAYFSALKHRHLTFIYFNKKENYPFWKAKAAFNISEAKRFARKHHLKVLPFISTGYWSMPSPRTVQLTPLSQKQMEQNLSFLKSLEVDGLVFWENPTTVINSSNTPANFDTTHGAFKAIVDFAKRQ